MNVDWLDGERSARFPIALPISRHQKAAGMGSVPHTWAYARKAPERSGRYRKSSTNAQSTQTRTMSDLLGLAWLAERQTTRRPREWLAACGGSVRIETALGSDAHPNAAASISNVRIGGWPVPARTRGRAASITTS